MSSPTPVPMTTTSSNSVQISTNDPDSILLAPRTVIFTPEHDKYREACRKFIREEVKPYITKWEMLGKVDKAVYQKAAKAGFYCMNIPEKYGGVGKMDFRYNVILTEEIENYDCGDVFFPLGNDIVLPYFTHIATEDQRQRWLPKIANGAIIAVCMSEPHAGSDLQAVSTIATPIEPHSGTGKRQWKLNGTKMWISNGAIADLYIMVCYTEFEKGHRGMTLFVVEKPSKGFQVVKTVRKIGRIAQDTAILSMQDVIVSEDDILGHYNTAFKHLMFNLPQERLSIAIGAVASLKRILLLTMKQLHGRTVFQRQLGTFQSPVIKMSEMVGEANMLQFLIDTAINLHLEQDENGKSKCSTELASLCKYRATEAAFKSADECLQFFGGYGYLRNSPIGKAFVNNRVAMIYGGTNEVMKEIIARRFGFQRIKVPEFASQIEKKSVTSSNEQGQQSQSQITLSSTSGHSETALLSKL